MKHYRHKADWQKLVAELPPGLSVKEASSRIGANRAHAYALLSEFGYHYPDMRGEWMTPEYIASRRKIDPTSIDWTKRDCEIRREFIAKTGKTISRERVRKLREKWICLQTKNKTGCARK